MANVLVLFSFLFIFRIVRIFSTTHSLPHSPIPIPIPNPFPKMPHSTTRPPKKPLFSFLALRDPTTSALAAAQKTCSPAKPAKKPERPLPHHVPRVNSKWDGLPPQPSTRAPSPKRRLGSLSSRPSAAPRRARARSRSRSHSRSRSRPSRRAAPPVDEPPHLAAMTFLDPPSPPPVERYELASPSIPAVALVLPPPRHACPLSRDPDAPPVPDKDTVDTVDTFFRSDPETDSSSRSASPTPVPASRPVVNFSRRGAPSARDTRGSRDPRDAPLPELPASVDGDGDGNDNGSVDGKGDGNGDDDATAAAADDALRPNLTNAHGRIDPFLTDTFAAQSRATGCIPAAHRRPATSAGGTSASSPAGPPAPGSDSVDFVDSASLHRTPSTTSLASSLAPSVMSARWALSPKQRLGLGGRVRRADVFPWEREDFVPWEREDEGLRGVRSVESLASAGGEKGRRGGKEGKGEKEGKVAVDEKKLRRLSLRFGGRR